MSLSVIIPCYWIDESLWNTTIDCLEQVFLQLPKSGEVIVVDDGSPWQPGGRLIPVPRPEALTFVTREKNGGYGAAVNAGMRAAYQDIRVVLNNDAYVQPGCLEKLVEAVRRDKGHIVTATNNHPIHGDDRATPCGSCWAISRQAWEEIGELDESFGVGAFEDTDYWFRARESGHAIWMHPDAKITTLGGQTIKRHPAHSAEFARNQAEIIRRWGSEHFRL